MPVDRSFLLGLLTGPLTIGLVALALSWKAAWIGMVCHGLIGFFLALFAMGYDNPALARGIGVGFALALLLSAHPLWLTFA